MKKTLTMVLALVLVAAISVGATLAYLTSTDKVVNTFTVGNVAITLDEAKVDANGKALTGEAAERVKANSYKLMPGHTYTKDPIVHVSSDSEDCYLFVKVTNEIAAIEDENSTVAAQMARNGWTLIDENNGIYVYGTNNALTKVSKNANVPVFSTFKIAGTVTNDELKAYNGETIVVNAYAIQADGFADKTASEIWTEANFHIPGS